VSRTHPVQGIILFAQPYYLLGHRRLLADSLDSLTSAPLPLSPLR
jgi:hypothetical protein